MTLCHACDMHLSAWYKTGLAYPPGGEEILLLTSSVSCLGHKAKEYLLRQQNVKVSVNSAAFSNYFSLTVYLVFPKPCFWERFHRLSAKVANWGCARSATHNSLQKNQTTTIFSRDSHDFSMQSFLSPWTVHTQKKRETYLIRFDISEHFLTYLHWFSLTLTNQN